MGSRTRLSYPPASNLRPYKATKLWNDVIAAFRQDVPRGKHRRYMRTAEDCFLGSTAVDWLLEYLKKQKDFGSDVTRQQTTQLLNKFYKAGIFEEIQVSRRGRNKADFSDSNRLYRLLPASPIKTPRVPLATRTANNLPPLRFDIDKDEKSNQQEKDAKRERNTVKQEKRKESDVDLSIDRLPQCHLVGKFLTRDQINEIWKTAALSRLKKSLGAGSLEDILQDYRVDGGCVRHNCIFLNKSGIVTNIQTQDELPHWVLSAMKCLARWPEKVEGDLPSYPGFEKDVFGVVRDYFMGLSEPLFPYDLYDVVINTFVQACNQLPRHSSPFAHGSRDEKRFGYSLWSDSSLENVILNLTRKYCMTDSKTDLFSLTDSRPDLFGVSESFPDSYSRLDRHSTAHSHSNLAHSQGNLTASHRQLADSHKDLRCMPQSHGGLQSITKRHSSALPWAHSKSHTDISRDQRSHSASSQSDLHAAENSVGHSHGHRSASNLHASSSSSRLNSQSSVGYFPDTSSFKNSKQFRSNPDLQVSRYETSFGPENQTVTRVFYSNGLATDFHHTSTQEQEELCPAETHFDVVTDKSLPQPSHLSSELVNKLSNSTTGSQSLRTFIGRPRSYNSFQQQVSREPISSTLPSSSVFEQEIEEFPNAALSPMWARLRKPPPYRKSRGERHNTFSGSRLAASQEERTGLDEWDRQLSSSTPYLPGLRLGADCQLSNTDRGPGQGGVYNQGLSSAPGSKRGSSLYLSLPQSGLHEERATNALQIVCLFLPPASRRKLHFLLKLMSKMSANPDLTFDPSQSTRSLVLGTFQQAVLRAADDSELEGVLVFQLLSFLMDHHADILAVPMSMKDYVQDRLAALNKPQIVYSPRDPSTLQFTRPMTTQQYEVSKVDNSRRALVDLLDTIVRDENMADREKRRRLKQFQKIYPDLYRQRFPDVRKDPVQVELRPRVKAPLLARPLSRLRGLRV